MASAQPQSALGAVEAAIRDASRDPRRLRDALARLSGYLYAAVGGGGGGGDPAALRDFFLASPGGVGGPARQSAYQALLSALFGLEEGGAAGWLAAASSASRAAEADALLSFLDPAGGPLLAAVAAADAAGFVQYAFPDELLPARARRLLDAGPGGVAALRGAMPWKALLDAPATAGRAPPLRLSPGRFFLFLVAYVASRPAGVGGAGIAQPASAGTASGGPAGGAGGRGAPAQLQHGAAALVSGALNLAHVRQSAPPPGAHPYRELLTRLLEHALPLPGAAAAVAAAAAARAAHHAATAGVGGSPGAAGLAARLGAAMPHAHAFTPQPQPPPPSGARAGLAVSGEELVAILREFWLSDPEDLPPLLSAAAAHAAAAAGSPAGRPGAPPPLPTMTWTYQPPTPDRLAAIKLLCVYVASALPSGVPAAPPPGSIGGALGGGGPSLAALCGVTPLAASLQRPLYRLLRGALAAWPPDSQAPLMPLLELWTAWLVPWDAARAGAAGAGAAAAAAAAPDERRTAHVVANAPFYLLLLQYFAAAACARVQVSARGAARELTCVLCAFAALGDQRLEALRALERAYNALVAPQDTALAARAAAAAAATTGGPEVARWAAAAPLPLASAVADWEAPAPRAQAAAVAAAAAAAAAARAPATPMTPPMTTAGAYGGNYFGSHSPARGYDGSMHAPATPLSGGGVAGGANPFSPTPRAGGLRSGPAAAAAAERAATAALASAAAPGRGALPRLLCFDAAEGVPGVISRLLQRIAAEAAAAAPGGGAAYAAELDHLLRARLSPAAMTVLGVRPPQPALAASDSMFPVSAATQSAAGAVKAEPPRRAGIAARFTGPQRRGDWMLRPIGSDEVPFLVRPLVAASQRANAALGIAAPDAATPVGAPLGCEPPPWLVQLGAAGLVKSAAARGLRVDLRFLAEKQTVAALAVLYVAIKLTAAFFRMLASL